MDHWSWKAFWEAVGMGCTMALFMFAIFALILVALYML